MSNNIVGAGSTTGPNNNNKGSEHNQQKNSRMSVIPREMTYHYAGKVHVRGLLRRVWRPRYLALGDDGYLRYHESIPPLYQQQNAQTRSGAAAHAHSSNIHHTTHRPKTILAILDGARTIDPHSMVDQHVALPQGVHGFVFRGRPVELTTADSSTANNERIAAGAGINSRGIEQQQGALIVPPASPNSSLNASKHSVKAAAVNLVFPKGTARRKTAQRIAKKAVNPDVLGGFCRTNCDGGMISRSSSSSSLMGYEQPLLEEENGNLGPMYSTNNNEWGLDSHESHDTMGSFQEVDGSQVYGDLDDNRVQNNINDTGANKIQMASSTTKTTVRVQVQASSVQSREYLCAVSTAEEAESWVVALGWAAEHRRRIKYANSPFSRAIESTLTATATSQGTSITNTPQSNEHLIDAREKKSGSNDEDRSSNTEKRSSSTLSSLLLEQEGWCKTDSGKTKSLFEDIPIEGTEAKATNETLKPVVTSSPPKKRPSSPGGATIIVTKVSKLRLPHNALIGWEHKRHGKDKHVSWFPLHFPLPGDDLVLQYGIQLLLLRHCKSRNDISVQPESVEERIIFKSVYDVLGLVHSLMTELDDENLGGSLIQDESEDSDRSTPTRKGSGRQSSTLSADTSNLLEDIESELLACLDSSGKRESVGKPSSVIPVIDDVSLSISKYSASIGTMDSVMRKLSKDKEICSSHPFQKFLHLSATHHHHKSTPIMMSKEADAEQIVKKWLSKTECISTRTKMELTLAVTFRHWLAGPGLSLMALWSITHVASLLWSMISGNAGGIVIPIPFETYATLVVLAFYFGRNNGVSSRNRKTILRSQKSYARKDDKLTESIMSEAEDDQSTVAEEEAEGAESEDEDMFIAEPTALSSPLPIYPDNYGISCWSKPDHRIFKVRSRTYLQNRVKAPSAPAVFDCRGVDIWLTENAERNIARHPSVLGGKLDQEDTFVVNFLLPFANLVAYFTIPPIEEMPANVANVWRKFIKGDQQYRDGKLKLLPVVVDGPWIVKKAVGPGTAPAVIGRDLPLQYYFTDPTSTKKGVYEVDVLVTASRIARGILNVVKGHTKSLTIAFAFIIEAAEEYELPETVLCAFQMHSIHLEDCPNLPDCYPDG